MMMMIIIIMKYLEPLSQWEVSSDYLELPRHQSTVKAIC